MLSDAIPISPTPRIHSWGERRDAGGLTTAG